MFRFFSILFGSFIPEPPPKAVNQPSNPDAPVYLMPYIDFRHPDLR